MENKIFIYRDSKGNVSAREVHSISKTPGYIQGICKKADSLRTFRKDRVLEYVENQNELHQRLSFHQANNPTPPPQHTNNRPGLYRSGSLPDICLTGFQKATKQELQKLAESFGLVVRSKVTVQLDCLVCGENAGPEKIKLARKQGVLIINENQFRALASTGSLPDEN